MLALALHLDPVYVGAHHLARFLVVTFSVAVAARRIAPASHGEPHSEASKLEEAKPKMAPAVTPPRARVP